jgi:fatty acid desaturase
MTDPFLAEQSIRLKEPLISQEAAAQGRLITRRDRIRYPIPAQLNLLLAVVQVSATFALLLLASRARHVPVLIVLAAGFAFVMQMGFCLAHEAVHRKLHPNSGVNLGAGIFMFSLFPGSFHFFEVAHLIHHRRNRSDDELEDYVLPGETAWVKRSMYYLLISGLFWLLLPLSSIVVAMIPRRRIRLPQPDAESGVFRKFAQFLNNVHPGRVRRDLLVATLVWSIAFPLLHLRFAAVALCYAAFGFSWASQQYIYHVRTPRHAALGALDLKLWRPVRWLYLNFNYHLTHHLAVWVPWNHLPSIAPQEPRQGYLQTYVALWQPPEPLAAAWPAQYQVAGPLPARMDRKGASGMDLPW